MAGDNKLLGQFDLVGIPPAPRGTPQIEVAFDIDANGIVNVSAKDKATNKEQNIRIQASGGLSESDIEEMVADAEKHASEDQNRRELVDARNTADSLIYTTEKAMSEHGDAVGPEDKAAIEGAIADLKAVLETEQTSEIQSKTETLAQVSQKLGEAMYRAQQEQAAPEGSSAGSQDDATVVDADFEEVDDDQPGSKSS